MNFPVTLEPGALDRARALIAKDGRPGAFLRIGVKGGGCSGYEYALRLDDSVRETDMISEIEGVRLACDPKSARLLEGTRLEYTGNLIGGGFVFHNPNAGRSCGCGSSFTLKTAK